MAVVGYIPTAAFYHMGDEAENEKTTRILKRLQEGDDTGAAF